MAEKQAKFSHVRIDKTNVKNFREYKRNHRFCPSLAFVVNYAFADFLAAAQNKTNNQPKENND